MSPTDALAARLLEASRITVLTGAGVSAASGVPTFRGENGLWRNVRAETLATAEAFENDPKLVWEWYDWRRSVIRAAQPNAAHHALAAWTRARSGVTVITQNVDGLHGIAGNSPEKTVELHGTDRKVNCLGCGKEFDPDPIYRRLEEDIAPPPCGACGGLLKPATISFGQPMPQAEMKRAQEWSEAAEVFIVVGSSLVVQPAASFPVIAKQNGALLVIVNRESTPLDNLADYNFRGAIGEFFTQLNPLLADG